MIIDFVRLVCGRRYFPSLQMKIKDRRKANEFETLFGILHTEFFGGVLVGKTERLLFDVLCERFVNIFAVFDHQRQEGEILRVGCGMIDIDALDVVSQMAWKEVSDGTFCFGALHLFFQVIHQHTVEFVQVLLSIRIVSAPAERGGQLFGADWRASELQPKKETLQSVRNVGIQRIILRRR